MSKRNNWSAAAVPGIRKIAVRNVLSGDVPVMNLSVLVGTEEEHAQGVAQRRDAPLYVGDVRDGMLGPWQDAFMDAGLWWVTIDMAKAALDASTDVPHVDLRGLVPDRPGFMLFSKPLPPVPWQVTSGENVIRLVSMPTDGISWCWVDGYLQVAVLTCGPDRNAKKIGPYCFAGLPEGQEPHEDDPYGDHVSTRALGGFLQAMFTLMSTPTVASVKAVAHKTGAARSITPAAAAAPSEVQQSEVRLIDLRPLRHVNADRDTDGGGGRSYARRWIVRGHWRNQAVGPKRGQRRATWIPSYIKGPHGAPFVEKETVMVWRR